ncbi:recombination protein F [Symmachiella dynata]|uniref:Recombination protein F n=1 Tax=Symmachiella dynata TaxID=2527995 RepID=A0A517ZQ15_9PLAN|nr:AAA family ATPase [Symmachiella dynata]QDU44579.1 recombination protein F [Symmachiella dynata]
MKISYFKIENFRNIRFAECENPPDFVVICGGNGCGKSAILQALMTAKERAGAYGGFNVDPRAVTANASNAIIEVRISFSESERTWYQENHGKECPEFDNVIINISTGGQGRATKRSDFTRTLLSTFSRKYKGSPGFFDYIDAHRIHDKKEVSTWDASSLSEERVKQTLGASGREKFQFTKEFLASKVLRDLQLLQAAHRQNKGTKVLMDSVAPIQRFFNRFFSPMEFVDVRIDTSPFQFIIRTPHGDIDIDDLSAGEKEILNTYIRFHQLQPRDAVILFDEADAHLHPDLERRYLQELRTIGEGNQVWLTTHSPEMMIEAGSESLYTVLKEPPSEGQNQFVRVTSSEELHTALSELMGSRGLVSFNQHIVFIEGTDASTDRRLYERFYPPNEYNISFVPAGDSRVIGRVAERVNQLLSESIGFQQFHAIVDGDFERAVPDPPDGRLHRLPVYHVENFLLDENIILSVLSEVLSERCPYEDEDSMVSSLHQLMVEDAHLMPFAKAVLDSDRARKAREVRDAIFSGNDDQSIEKGFESYAEALAEARSILEGAISDDTWRSRCKARDLLRALCGKHGINYEHFRNLVISRMDGPPPGLQAIIGKILES